MTLTGLVAAILVASLFVPLCGIRSHYCFHCGIEAREVRVLGVSYRGQ